MPLKDKLAQRYTRLGLKEAPLKKSVGFTNFYM